MKRIGELTQSSKTAKDIILYTVPFQMFDKRTILLKLKIELKAWNMKLDACSHVQQANTSRHSDVLLIPRTSDATPSVSLIIKAKVNARTAAAELKRTDLLRNSDTFCANGEMKHADSTLP